MSNDKYKPKLIIDGYIKKKQLHGLFKVVEFSHFSNERFQRKRVLCKNKTLDEADEIIYKLEKNINH